jgi:hypothetical protein
VRNMKVLAWLGAFLALSVLSGRMSAAVLAAETEPDAIFDALEKKLAQPVLLAQEKNEEAPRHLKIEQGDEPIHYDTKLSEPGTPLDGKSIEELIVGKPVFPPIEGLDPSIWQNKNCGTCHQWTRERLCTQAKTYIGHENMVERLKHPYGLIFKQVLERWGQEGCQ